MLSSGRGVRRVFRRACAICGETAGELLYQQQFAREEHASFLDGYDVVACGRCGFAFADCIPDQEWFDAYYGAMSKYEDATRRGNGAAWEEKKMRLVAQAMIPHVPTRSAQIVDIGCATGMLLAHFSDAGFAQLLGVDPSPVCARMAREQFNLQVNTGTFSNLNLPKEFADVMILAGVLEHVRDLAQALDKIVSHTKKGGRVFISVPNAARYAEGEDAPFQEFSMEHINFFGPGSLANLMASRGFTAIAMIEEMLPVNLRTTTPVVHGIFCMPKEASPRLSRTIKDTATIDGLRNYLTQCRSEDERIRNLVADLVREKRPLLVWGVGTHTLRLLAESSLGQANIVAFVDGNPRYHGCRVHNIPVLAPEVLRDYPDAAVLISSRAYQEEIALEIRQQLKCRNEIVRFYSLTQE